MHKKEETGSAASRDTDVPSEEMAVATDGDSLNLLLPEMNPDSDMPELWLALIACAVKLRDDPEFRSEQVEWMRAARKVMKEMDN